jgi:hypothetical protein
LEKYKDIVFESAAFMASYPHWDEQKQCYDLGPPMKSAPETQAAKEMKNPLFELSYWKWGLEIAQQWRERIGLKRDEKWDHVLQNLADYTIKNGLYVESESAQNTFEEGGKRYSHPALVGAFGMLPGGDIDQAIMRKTLNKVIKDWNWKGTWGWDFPLVAMTAARLGEADIAINTLLMDSPKNRYLVNGHNYKDQYLPIYLPGNGSLLATVAMMAAGWDGAPAIHAPGFPQDGTWTVSWEGLRRIP